MKDIEVSGMFKDYIIRVTENMEPVESDSSLHCFHAVYDVAGTRYRVEGSLGQEFIYVYLEDATNE